MTNHAVKEPITDNTLYVEVDEQPRNDGYCHLGAMLDGSPIAIGDTVYQGEEWGDPIYDPILLPRLWKKVMELCSGYWKWYSKEPIETMPIELADKTFKVVGIEVEWMLAPDGINEPPPTKTDMRWLWSYKLEEIK